MGEQSALQRFRKCASPPGFLAALILLVSSPVHAELRVPAFTAYLDPPSRRVGISTNAGVTGWKDPGTKISWFGEFKTTGRVDVAVALRLPTNSVSRLRLTVAEEARDVEILGAGTNAALARFGGFEVKNAGYIRFTLASLNPVAQPAGDIEALLLDGPAARDAHFNLDPRRNAASVHLNYPVPPGTRVAAFYCEVTGVEDPVATFYMACGWHRGYFGMQVNSATERRIIFSVWDSSAEGVDRRKVGAEDRATLEAKGEGVFTGDFGNEGTGGHSHLKYLWRTGETQRFLVTARPVDGSFTVFSGYYFHPGRREWMLISSWRAPKDGGWLRRLHSFSENFIGNNGHLRRKALYGNQWIRTEAGQWIELNSARFTHDATGWTNRLDRFMGMEDGRFFLSHGGFVPGFTKSGQAEDRPVLGRAPADLEELFSRGLPRGVSLPKDL